MSERSRVNEEGEYEEEEERGSRNSRKMSERRRV